MKIILALILIHSFPYFLSNVLLCTINNISKRYLIIHKCIYGSLNSFLTLKLDNLVTYSCAMTSCFEKVFFLFFKIAIKTTLFYLEEVHAIFYSEKGRTSDD
jgi:hypothetical protein